MKILIVSTRNDSHSDAVSWGLSELGVTPTIWYWEEFPFSDQSTVRFSPGRDPVVKWKGERGDFSGPFDVIWMRRKGTPVIYPGTHDDDADIAKHESLEYITNVLAYLGHPQTRWINHPIADFVCNSKLHQLVVASRIGFNVPDTLIGNAPGEVREFCDEYAGDLIHKSFSPGQWDNMDGTRTVLKTSAVGPRHVANDFPIRACPSVYQPRIQKKFELRVTVMGNSAIAALIDSQKDGPTVDWRCEGGRGQTNLRPYDLSSELHYLCVRLCHELNLAFGCIDLVVDTQGRTVFLEVNNLGQFLWKEVFAPEIPMLRSFCLFLIGTEHLKSPTQVTWAKYSESRQRKKFLDRLQSRRP